MNGDEVLEQLMKGNDKFVNEQMTHGNLDKERRIELLAGQSPQAAILTCSDSRVVPEHIFDQGLGDIFIIRNAGNVVAPVTLGSLEYAAAHLKTPLMMVLGHSQCGAVGAAMAGGEPEGSLGSIMTEIGPAVSAISEDIENRYDEVIIENTKNSIKNILTRSSMIKDRVDSGDMLIIGAIYNLDSGKVNIIKL